MAAPDQPPLVDIVIVAYNSAAHLPRLFMALEGQTERRFTVVVFDNASEPASRPANAPDWVRVVQSEANLGFAAGNNRAATYGAAPFLAFLNPDAFPEPGWLAALLAAAQRWPGAAAFGSTQIAADDPSLTDGLGDVMHASGVCYRAGYRKPLRAPPPEGETFSACAAAMLIRRSVFEDVGGFDERFFCFGEDVDLGFRLRLRGWASVQVPEAVVLHLGGASAGRRSAFADRLAVRNRLWTFLKNMPAPLLWLLLPLHVAATLALLASYPLSGRGWAGWRGALEGLVGLPATLRDRRRIQRARVASARSVASALSWSPLALLRRAPVIIRRSA